MNIIHNKYLVAGSTAISLVFAGYRLGKSITLGRVNKAVDSKEEIAKKVSELYKQKIDETNKAMESSTDPNYVDLLKTTIAELEEYANESIIKEKAIHEVSELIKNKFS